MDQTDYLEERLEDQIKWYDKKSKYCQMLHKLLRGVEIIAAALIPFLVNMEGEWEFIIGLLGVTIAVCAGISSLNKYQENWISYRTTSESLKHHKYLFLAKAEPYSSSDAWPKFAEQIEFLISKENSQWMSKSKQPPQELHKQANNEG